MSLTSDKKKWDDLHAALAKASEAANAYDRQLHSHYGRYQTQWLKKGERAKLETLRDRRDKIGDKIVALLVQVSPRGEAWLSGVPAHWIRNDLTWEDAIRPKGEPLSIVPPTSYGNSTPIREASMENTASGRYYEIKRNRFGWRAVLYDKSGHSINVINGDSEESVRRSAQRNWPEVPETRPGRGITSREAPMTNQDPDPEAAGAQYADEQINGEYFMNWVHDQLLEASKMDPSEVLPLETEADASKIAKNMLQQLEWDTKRDLSPKEIADLIGVDSASRDDVQEFYKGFSDTLKTNNEWLAGELLERHQAMGGTRVSEARRGAQKYFVVDQVQGGLWVQVGHFHSKGSAERFLATLGGKNRIVHTFPSAHDHTPILKREEHRMRAGGMPQSLSMYAPAQVFINGKYQVTGTMTPSHGPEEEVKVLLHITRPGDVIEVRQEGSVWTFIRDDSRQGFTEKTSENRLRPPGRRTHPKARGSASHRR